MLETPATLDEDPAAGDWIEIRKLVSGLRDGFVAANLESPFPYDRGGRGAPYDLEVELANAPDEIRVEEALLATSLRALLDWAAAKSPGDENDSSERDGIPAIRIEVDALHEEAVSFRVTTASDGPEDNVAAAAALEVAARAAKSMGGRIDAETTPGSTSQRIVITTAVRNH